MAFGELSYAWAQGFDGRDETRFTMPSDSFIDLGDRRVPPDIAADVVVRPDDGARGIDVKGWKFYLKAEPGDCILPPRENDPNYCSIRLKATDSLGLETRIDLRKRDKDTGKYKHLKVTITELHRAIEGVRAARRAYAAAHAESQTEDPSPMADQAADARAAALAAAAVAKGTTAETAPPHGAEERKEGSPSPIGDMNNDMHRHILYSRLWFSDPEAFAAAYETDFGTALSASEAAAMQAAEARLYLEDVLSCAQLAAERRFPDAVLLARRLGGDADRPEIRFFASTSAAARNPPGDPAPLFDLIQRVVPGAADPVDVVDFALATDGDLALLASSPSGETKYVVGIRAAPRISMERLLDDGSLDDPSAQADVTRIWHGVGQGLGPRGRGPGSDDPPAREAPAEEQCAPRPSVRR